MLWLTEIDSEDAAVMPMSLSRSAIVMPVGDTGLLLLGIPLSASILMKFAPTGPFMTEL